MELDGADGCRCHLRHEWRRPSLLVGHRCARPDHRLTSSAYLGAGHSRHGHLLYFAWLALLCSFEMPGKRDMSAKIEKES